MDSGPFSPPSASDLGRVAPGASQSLAPETIEDLATLYRDLDAVGTTTMVLGGGTHLGIGYPVYPQVVVSTENLKTVIDHQPEDLTLTVEAGVTLGEIEDLLAPHRQSAVLPETNMDATIGGVVAAGISGYRRHRFGPTRDRLLEVTVVTGDGRLVTGGARVVKNVSGYDLPRLVCGSFGGVGVVASVCLKLWPEPEARAMISLDDLSAVRELHRPLAVIETRRGLRAYVQGPAADVVASSAVGVVESDEFVWPAFGRPGSAELRVPSSRTAEAVSRIPSEVPFIAQHGVGIVAVASEDSELLRELRTWCESVGGALVVTSRSGEPDDVASLDPWGTPPAATALQRRLIAGFDPRRIINRGRLPGKI